jgi:bifunctional non-homologous end joining protein LigD
MGLALYKKKRKFGETAEPAGGKAKKGSLIFVVQEHAASHLHYDFRLEMEGVLKSWAVPKGPSLNPEDKRLAMMVEDHPYDYKDFEGNIPAGNYGGGNVIVWDNGTYHALDGGDEKSLLAGLHKGHISFILEGKKLKGEFSLVKIKGGRQENAWLLIKKDDKYASDIDVTKKNKSVISKVTLDALAKKYHNKGVNDYGDKKAAKKAPIKKVASKKVAAIPVEIEAAKVPVKKKARQLKPMLASLGDKPFDDDEWIFEPKYDGYRVLALCDGKGGVSLYSRNLLSFDTLYASIREQLKTTSHACLLDGEVVIENEKGRSDFQLLQQYQKSRKGILKYYVFDLLNLDDNDTVNLPLLQRKDLLKMLLEKYKFKTIFYSDHIVGAGIKYFEQAIPKSWEGIMAKRATSMYLSDKRTKDWLKLKITNEEEAVIGGITSPKGSRGYFGSLLLGAYDEAGDLIYTGNCGTGFDTAALKELYAKFKPLFTDKSPFVNNVKLPNAIQWLKPKLVCQVKFTEWTDDNSMRHPVYMGLRVDKKATEVIRQKPADMTKIESSRPPKSGKKAMPAKAAKKTGAVEAKVDAKSSEVKVGKATLKLTNPQKIYWPEDKITKGELVKYYEEIAPVILPYLKDRPESLHRFPNGINSPSFYQKDIDIETTPDWLHTEKVYSDSNKENIDYLICNDKETLMYMANLGCIEIHPWNSKYTSQENPDWLVIDLDPEDISFAEVIKCAQLVHKVFDKLEMTAY